MSGSIRFLTAFETRLILRIGQVIRALIMCNGSHARIHC